MGSIDANNLAENIAKISLSAGPIPVTATVTVSTLILLVSKVVLQTNLNRKGLIIYNNSANSVYLGFGLTVTGATCTRILATFTQFEMLGPTVYVGAISAIRNAGTGALNITEFI